MRTQVIRGDANEFSKMNDHFLKKGFKYSNTCIHF